MPRSLRIDDRGARDGSADALRARHVLLGGAGHIRSRRGEGLLHRPLRLAGRGAAGGSRGHLHNAATERQGRRDPLQADRGCAGGGRAAALDLLELATRDVERAKSFFGELLGWAFEMDDTGHTSIKNAGRLNGGMREQTEQEGSIPPNWLPYFTVQNVDDAAHRAERAGGRRLVPTTNIHMGRFAVIADPQGAAFAVCEGQTDPDRDSGTGLRGASLSHGSLLDSRQPSGARARAGSGSLEAVMAPAE